MNPLQTSNQEPQAGKDPTRSLLADFDQDWHAGQVPSIAEYLARLSSTDVAVRRAFLEELVMIDLEYRWRQQSPHMQLRLEDYSRDIPMLAQLKCLSPELIGAEYRVRRRWGDHPAPAEYLTRFPDQAASLRTTLAEVEAEMASETPQGSLERSEKINISEDSEAVPMAAAIEFPLLPVVTQPVASAVVVLNGNPPPREIVLGPYVILERIGEGGIGQVFKARHAHMNRIVAIKILHSKLVTDPEVTRRFIREVQLAARFDHPHVVRAFDAGPAGSVYFLALEYVPGTDLSRLVKQQGPLPVSLACNYIWQAALGLQYAHEQGMVHRGIKPANLLLTKSSEADPIGLIKVADFGMARLTIHESPSEAVALPHDGEESSGSTTATGLVVMGTIDYMAPEQAIDFHTADIRADIYSLGCTFYHLLTGHGPYSGTQAQKMLKHQQADIPDARLERPDVPAAVVDILTRMMAKRPEERFQTPAEVAVALAPLCGVATLVPAEPERNQSTNAEGVPSNDRSGVRGRRASGRSRLSVGWIVGGGVLSAMIAVGGAWWFTQGRSPTESKGIGSGELTPGGSTEGQPAKPAVLDGVRVGQTMVSFGCESIVADSLVKAAGIKGHRWAGGPYLGPWREIHGEPNLDKKRLEREIGDFDVLLLATPNCYPIAETWAGHVGLDSTPAGLCAIGAKNDPKFRLVWQSWYWPPYQHSGDKNVLEWKPRKGPPENLLALEKLTDQINEKHGRKVMVISPVEEATCKLIETVAAGKFPGITDPSELWFDGDMWTPGTHMRTLFAYTNVATIYGVSPVGLNPDFSSVTIGSNNPTVPKSFAGLAPITEEQRKILQKIAWDTVSSYPFSGVKNSGMKKS